MTRRVTGRLAEATIDGAPGDTSTARVTLTSTAPADAGPITVSIRSIGFDEAGSAGPAGAPALRGPRGSLTVAVQPGGTEICEIPIVVPPTVAAGRHTVAIEIIEPGERPQLLDAVVAVASVRRVELIPTPSPIRGRRRAKFYLDVVNHEPHAVDFFVTGEAEDVTVKFDESRFRLEPGERATTKAKLRGPRLWRGEPLQHNLLLTARTAASTSTATAPFVQRPVFVRGARVALAALALIAVWIAGIVGLFWWLNQRGDDAEFAFGGDVIGVDSDGDGVADQFYNASGDPVATPDGVDTDGDGIVDSFVDASGKPVETITAVDTDGDGTADVFLDETGRVVPDPSTGVDGTGTPDEIASSVDPTDLNDDGTLASASDGPGSGAGNADVDLPTSTDVGGTVAAPGTDDLSGLSVTLTPIATNGPQVPSETSAGVTKYWPVRTTRAFDSGGTVRQSETVTPLVVAPDADGVWQFNGVPLRRSYELAFSGPGYDTYTSLLTPPDDGSPVSLDIELTPAVGAIRGRVTGAGGALGGADIIVSDGRTTFTTTADTEGDPGSFRLDGLSTPGVYTMTTRLDGYATDVRQIDLGAGEQANGVDVVLQRGVATVTGRITDTSGRALPGADIVASNGADQRSTTSFTAGDLGAYSLPQLTIGTVYTISVNLDGYGTQTRRVSVNGSISGVNIVLAPTSSTISGTVASSTGGGIVGAGVILQNGDLEFRTSTAETPAGSFEVADLPSGSYTVTIEHFEHETSTQFVDVIAGVNPPPVNVTLQRLDGPPSVGVGELVVEVVDPDAETAEERQISGATVILTRSRTPKVEREVTQDEFDFRITDIPVGTYTLVVEAAGYAPSAPRQVSIGLQAERREVELQKLGAARGRVVDALTKQPVTDGYALELFIVTANGNVIPANRTLIGQTDGTWQTEPRELPPGEYLLVPSNPPIGYEILSDQRIDPDANGLMRFTLTGDLLEPKAVGDIEADPYPDIRGRVLTPRLVGAVTELDPINSNSLNAVLSCSGVSATLTAELLDIADPQTTPLYDQFFFDFKEVDRNDLVGDCRVDVTADGYVAGSVSVPNLEVSDGFADPDRTANVALSVGPDSFGGQVFWENPRGSVPVFLPGVAFSTRAITRIDPAEGSGGLPGTEPDPVLSDLSSTSVGGVWALDGQIFGTATYDVVAANFPPASMDVSIDEAGNRTVSSLSNLEVAPTSAPIDSSTSYDVKILSPAAGQVNGQVNIYTTGNPAFTGAAGVGIAAVDPDGNPYTGTITALTPVAGTGTGGLPYAATYTIPSAAAGTWDVDFTLPDNHILYAPTDPLRLPAKPPATRATEVVDPAETQAGFDTTLVDLATVEVRVIDRATNAAITTGATTALAAVSGDAVAKTTPDESLPASGTYRFDEVVVDRDDPTTVNATYSLSVDVPLYDGDSATISVSGLPGPAGPFNDIDNIPLPVVAGSDVVVTIALDEYGSITGRIEGETGDPSNELLDVDGTPAAVVVARDVQTGQIATDITITSGPNPGEFVATGPPGTYSFDVSHPEFGAPTSFPDSDTVNQGEYILVNGAQNTLTNAFVLPIRRVSLEVTAFEEVDVNSVYITPVNDFEVTLTNGPAGSAPTPVTTTTGTAQVLNLLPGTYQVTVRSYDGATTDQDQFPFITSITIRRSSTTGVDTTTELTAVMPSVRTGVDLVVQAENSEDELVALPAVTVTRTYTPPNAGQLTDDQGGDVEVSTPDGNSEDEMTTAGASPQTLAFRDLVAVGSGHVFTFGTSAGYIAPASFPLSVPNATGVYTIPNPAVYDVYDVTAQFTVTATPTDGDFVDLTARLISLDNSRSYSCALVEPPPVGAWTFDCAGVPAGVPYQVELIDDLYQPTAPTTLPRVNVPIYTGADTPPTELVVTATEAAAGDLSLTTTVGRVEVSVRNDAGDPVNPQAIELTPSVGAAIPMVQQSNGEYRVDVAPGSYTLNVSNGLGNSSVVDLPVTVELGKTSTDTVTLRRLVQIDVTLDPTPPVGAVARLQNDGQFSFSASSTALVGTTTLATFYVPRNDNYRVVVEGGGYPQLLDPRDNNYFRVRPNDTLVTRTVSIPRVVTVDVSNATATTQVQLTNTNGSAFSPDLVDTSPPFSFELDSTTGVAPGVGELHAVVTSTDRRTEIVNIPDTFTSSPSVTLRPLITVSGQLTTSDGAVVPNGTVIEAVETDATFTPLATPERREGTVGDNNSYSISGFKENFGGPTNGVRYFRIDLTVDGVGVGEAQITIDQSSPSTVPTNFTLNPRMTRSITVNVVDETPAGVDGATVTLTANAPGVFTTSAPTPTAGQAAGVVVFTGISETLALTVSVAPPTGSSLGPPNDVPIAAGITDVTGLTITLPAI